MLMASLSVAQVQERNYMTLNDTVKSEPPIMSHAHADRVYRDITIKNPPIPVDSVVSMNMWGFSASFLQEVKQGFVSFLEENLVNNPMKCEYYLPTVVSNLLADNRATVAVLTSIDRWYGVTYKEDKPVVVAAIKNMKEAGLYPKKLWN